jgi:hypothetical protein
MKFPDVASLFVGSKAALERRQQRIIAAEAELEQGAYNLAILEKNLEDSLATVRLGQEEYDGQANFDLPSALRGWLVNLQSGHGNLNALREFSDAKIRADTLKAMRAEAFQQLDADIAAPSREALRAFESANPRLVKRLRALPKTPDALTESVKHPKNWFVPGEDGSPAPVAVARGKFL